MRIVGRTENERKRCACRNYRPISRRVEPVAPDIRALHFAAIEMNHRRIEFRSWKLLWNRGRRCFRFFVTGTHFFGKLLKRNWNTWLMYGFVGCFRIQPIFVCHNAFWKSFSWRRQFPFDLKIRFYTLSFSMQEYLWIWRLILLSLRKSPIWSSKSFSVKICLWQKILTNFGC